MRTVCKFRFPDGTDRNVIETQIAMAITAAECTYGHPKVRICAAYLISPNKPEIAIDVSTEVGEHIAQTLTGLIMRQFWEDGFSVERIYGDK
jgi:hypothetical protein